MLTQDGAALKQILADYPGFQVVVEGHCDERGSAEYNLGLGDRRAKAAQDFLVQLGVQARPSEDYQLRQRAPGMQRTDRRVLPTQPPRAFLPRSVTRLEEQMPGHHRADGSAPGKGCH